MYTGDFSSPAINIDALKIVLEAKFKDGHVFKLIIESLAAVVEQVCIEVTPHGLLLRAMDSAHVVHTQICLSGEGFEAYKCEQPALLRVDVRALATYLKFVEVGKELILSITDLANQYLILRQNNSKGEAELNFKLLGGAEDPITIPEKDYAVSIVMGSARFAKLVKDMH